MRHGQKYTPNLVELPRADAACEEVVLSDARVPATRPPDNRFAADAAQQSFQCDGANCGYFTRNPAAGGFLYDMRKCPAADREGRWLAGGDATWMCIPCWQRSLDTVSQFLGLPSLAPQATTQRPLVADHRLGQRHRSPQQLICDRCGHPHLGFTREGHGTFLFDRHNRHIWSLDSVRAEITPGGACVDLVRPSRQEYRPPPVSASPHDQGPARFQAWDTGSWDATWFCWDCAAGLCGHQAAWMIDAKVVDFALDPAISTMDAPVKRRGQHRNRGQCQGGGKARKADS